jgi:hypothetical protein
VGQTNPARLGDNLVGLTEEGRRCKLWGIVGGGSSFIPRKERKERKGEKRNARITQSSKRLPKREPNNPRPKMLALRSINQGEADPPSNPRSAYAHLFVRA